MPTARRRAHLLPPLPAYKPSTAPVYTPLYVSHTPLYVSHTHLTHLHRHAPFFSQERWHRNAQAKGELLLLKHKLHRERYATHGGLQPRRQPQAKRPNPQAKRLKPQAKKAQTPG